MRKFYRRKIMRIKKLCRQRAGCQDGVYLGFRYVVFLGINPRKYWKYWVFGVWKSLWKMWITLCSVLWGEELCQTNGRNGGKRPATKSVKWSLLLTQRQHFSTVHFDESARKDFPRASWQKKLYERGIKDYKTYNRGEGGKRKRDNWQRRGNVVQWRPWQL